MFICINKFIQYVFSAIKAVTACIHKLIAEYKTCKLHNGM